MRHTAATLNLRTGAWAPLAALVVSVAGLATTPAAFAQNTAAQPDKVVIRSGESILEQARAAAKNLKALSYKAEVLPDMPAGAKPSGPLPATSKDSSATAQVAAARADAGGWKLYAQGQSGKDTFEIGYDAVTAYAVRSKERTVLEKAPSDMSDLAMFFATQSARHPIAWELLADKPFDDTGHRVTFEGVQDYNGERVDVVLLTPISAAATPSAAPNANPKVNPKAPATTPAAAPAAAAITGTRYFFSMTDHLPRRIERLGEAGPNAARVIAISEVKINDQAMGAPFAMSIPDGFRVRAADPGKRDAAKGSSGKGESKAKAKAKGRLMDKPAPDFALKDTTGKEWKLSGLKGKVVFLDFWATWCGPCRVAMPGVQAMNDRFKDKDVVIFGVNIDEPGVDVAGFLKKNKFTYPNLMNAQDVAQQYAVNSIPAFFLIGPDGKVIYQDTGYPQGKAEQKKHDDEIIAMIDDALKAAGK